MGLDVYVHRVKKSVADKYGLDVRSETDEVYEALKEEAKDDFKKKTTSFLNQLEYQNQSADEYRQSYMEFIHNLSNNIDLYRNYEWFLNDFGYNYQTEELNEVKTPSEAKEVLEKHLSRLYPFEDAYFRKVNFIYAHFQYLVVDKCCLVGKCSISNLLETCKEVLKNKDNIDFAKDNLPTINGFFFGSTEYDDYYYNDVEDCLNKMEALYNSMDDGEFVLWVFSW